MKRFLLFLLFTATLHTLYAQYDAYMIPEYNKIKTEIVDPESDYYYPKLLERYNALDTTFTLNEFRYLYYGNVYQSNYQPYWISPYQKELDKYYKSAKIAPKDYDDLIRLASKSVQSFPFDLDDINTLEYIYKKKGDLATSRKYSAIFMLIIHTILSSGDGKSEESAYHVISVSHEYMLLRLFGFQSKGQMLIQGKNGACDVLDLIDNKENVSKIYFNVNQLFKKNSEKFKNLK